MSAIDTVRRALRACTYTEADTEQLLTQLTAPTAPVDNAWLAEIQARADAATPGPWCTDSWEIYQGAEYEPGISFWIGETCRAESMEQDRADAEFVAAARSDVPALVAEVQALRDQRERRRLRLIFLQNDALNMRGTLAPADGPRRVPFELGETLTPAVEWLLNRVAELEGRPSRAEVLNEAADLLAEIGSPITGERSEHERGLMYGSERLRRMAAGETAAAGEDPCRPCGCPKRFNRHADGCNSLPDPGASNPAEYRFCGADLGRDEFPFTCNRLIAHQGSCSSSPDDTPAGAAL